MKIFYPSYYIDFKCIAEKCRHSCCIGWEISVDPSTLEKYESLGREDILLNIKDGDIILCGDGRCPFLGSDGLCSIISGLGEEYIPDICREHPRFYHRVGKRIECGVGASCQEACRIILSSDGYSEFYTTEGQVDTPDETDFDSLSHRDCIYSLLSDPSLSYTESIRRIREKYSLSEPIHSADEWKEILFSLEYLDERHRGLCNPGVGREEYHKIYERFFAYLLFRHLSVAENYENLRARLGFCLLLCSILEGYTVKGGLSFADICEYARVISEEIEYSRDNTASLIFEFECCL